MLRHPLTVDISPFQQEDVWAINVRRQAWGLQEESAAHLSAPTAAQRPSTPYRSCTVPITLIRHNLTPVISLFIPLHALSCLSTQSSTQRASHVTARINHRLSGKWFLGHPDSPPPAVRQGTPPPPSLSFPPFLSQTGSLGLVHGQACSCLNSCQVSMLIMCI